MEAAITRTDSRLAGIQAVLFDGAIPQLLALLRELAERPGPIIPVIIKRAVDGDDELDRLVREVCVSTNTAAAGGNASLMSIG